MKRFRNHSPTYYGLLIYCVLSLGSMATMSIGIISFLILFILGEGSPRKSLSDLKGTAQFPFIRIYLIASGLLFAACLASIISTKFFPVIYLPGKFTEVSWFRDLAKTWYFILPWVFFTAWKRLKEGEFYSIFRVWMIWFGILSFVGVIQFFTGWPRGQPNPDMPGFFHSTLFLGHHLSVANVWIFPFFMGLDLFTQPQVLKKLKIPQGVLGLILIVSGFTLFFTYSRTLWVALPIGLILWGWFKFPKKIFLSLVLLLCLVGSTLYPTSFVQNRLKSQIGISDRMKLWNANLEFFKERPWFGVGFGKNQELSSYYLKKQDPDQTSYFVGHAHNIFLEVLAGLGIFGALAWIFWLVTVIQPTLISRSSFSIGIFCAWVVFLLNGMTQVNFWESKVLHQLMWVIGLSFYGAYLHMSSSKRNSR